MERNILDLPKSYNNNQWSYERNSIEFNGNVYETEDIKAYDLELGDVILITNGSTIIGIGEVIRLQDDYKFDKYRNEVKLIAITVKMNHERNMSSYSCSEELDYLIRKINL